MQTALDVVWDSTCRQRTWGGQLMQAACGGSCLRGWAGRSLCGTGMSRRQTHLAVWGNLRVARCSSSCLRGRGRGKGRDSSLLPERALWGLQGRGCMRAWAATCCPAQSQLQVL